MSVFKHGCLCFIYCLFSILCCPYLRDKYGTALAGLKGEVHGVSALDALYKKSNWLEGIQVKNHHWDVARDDGA
jgi:hypothetical protein